MWIEKVTDKLSEIYGEDKAGQVSMNIMPSCIADFSKMLEKAAPGDTVNETYRTEDGLAELFFTGIKTDSVSILKFVDVNGQRVTAEVEL
ncbi:MAG: hypothetical protein IJV16_05235 [Lachnospiraceae bacterium]|nr:hypothetical protein [Lachnospiraceae bacterium]